MALTSAALSVVDAVVIKRLRVWRSSQHRTAGRTTVPCGGAGVCARAPDRYGSARKGE